jgi:hypothetical protein
MEHTDVLFAIQWPRPKRQLLPEGFCIHLQSSAEFGANWQGRKTPPFRQTAGTGTVDSPGRGGREGCPRPVTY